ncbi:MAG: hypothetical protein ABII00_00100 [Elusimicrobiota bacterium]
MKAQTATVDGSITTDGAPGSAGCNDSGGGGAGGSIRIEAGSLYGGGSLSADGGNGADGLNSGGGGAGGRIALLTTGVNRSTITLSAAGGARGVGTNGGADGGAGTTFIEPKVWTGLGAADCKDPANWVNNQTPRDAENVVFGSTGTTKNCTFDFDSLSIGSLSIGPDFSALVFWNNLTSEIAGDLTMSGGQFGVGNIELKIQGDWTQTAGTLELSQGTVAFNGSAAQSVSVHPLAKFNNFHIYGGASVSSISDLDVNGVITIKPGGQLSLTGANVLRASSTITGGGSLTATAGHETFLDGTGPQTVTIGGFGRLRIANAAGVTFPAPLSVAVLSTMTINSGAALNAADVEFDVGGDWNNRGTFNAPGGTVAFTAAGATQTVIAGGRFSHLVVQGSANVVVLATATRISSGVTVASGLLKLGNQTHLVRGDWTVGGGSVDGETSAVVFDGASDQRIFSGAGSTFHDLAFSNTGFPSATVFVSSGLVVTGDLELNGGRLDIAGRAVEVKGDLRDGGGDAFVRAGSTVTMSGAGAQSLDFASFATERLVIANMGGGVLLTANHAVERSFKVLPGAAFDGRDKVLALQGAGALWDTAGAGYTSFENDAHTVRWQPPAGESVFVAAGSTVNAKVEVYETAVLQGDLFVAGSSNTLRVLAGQTLDAAGSTITLRESSDIVFDGGSGYRFDAGSWIVFEGGGAGRGAALSSGPLANVRFDPVGPSDSFLLGDLFLEGDLVIEGGRVVGAADATLSIKGDFINTGGGFDYVSQGASTVSFTGSAEQRVRMNGTETFSVFEVDSSSSVVLTSTNTLSVQDSLLLTSGTLRGGGGLVSLAGDWTGTGGRFVGEGSTVAFTNPSSTQTYADATRQQLHILTVSAGTKTFNSALSADVFEAQNPGTLLEFEPGELYTIGALRINGQKVSDPVVIRSSRPGAAFRLDVTVSTVTAADVRDSDATPGPVVYANDGRSVDRGNNPGWEFSPEMLIVAPGESFSEGAGKSGSADTQVAGSTFTVTVLAVSHNFTRVTAATDTVKITSDDPFDVEPATAPLAGGTTQLSLTLVTAEPGPRPTVLSVSTFPGGAASAGAIVPVVPTGFDRLQVVLAGESPLPGSASGLSGVPDQQITGLPFGLTVRGTDRFWNLISGATDTVALTETTSSSFTLPGAQTLAAGATAFAGILVYEPGQFTITASDVSNVVILPDASTIFPVFRISESKPTLTFSIPLNATVGTLSGRLAGRAQDSVSVAGVAVALKDVRAGRYFDWSAETFSLVGPDEEQATVTPFREPDVEWTIAIADARLTNGNDYYVVVKATNPSSIADPAAFTSTLVSTFTFDAGALIFGVGDGEGSAWASTPSTAGCQALVVTSAFTVGPSGIGPGGAVGLRVPEGWTRPQGLHAGPVPPTGYVTIESTSTAWTVAGSSEVLFNPPSIGSVTLGDNWVALRLKDGAPNSLKPDEEIRFIYKGLPPAGPAGLGEQTFDLRTQGDAEGSLVSISTVPKISLTAGAARSLRFSEYRRLSLGPLQLSPTMQLVVTDACGNQQAAAGNVEAALSVGTVSATGFFRDSGVEFLLSGGISTGSVTVAAGLSVSPEFRYRTSSAVAGSEFVRATATVSGTSAEASRLVGRRAAPAALSGVSIDTGTLAPGATSVVLVPGVRDLNAFIRFGLSDSSVDWEMSVATGPGAAQTVFRASGPGDPDRPIQVTFDGIACAGSVCRFVAPGVYKVRIAAAGGAVENNSLEVRVSTTPWVFGDLGISGAGAVVRAEGPGAGLGNFALADSSGAFRIFGLAEGRAYNVIAATETFAQRQVLSLSTGAFGVWASTSGTDVGTLGFPAPAFIRVSVGIPILAPEEFWGRVRARNAGYSRKTEGTLHFARSAASSDDGAQTLGRTASTWTVLGLPPDTYELEIDLAAIGISTRVTGVAVSTFTDVVVPLRRKANVYGSVVLPSTKPFGAWVSVMATRPGERAPARFKGAFVEPASGGVVPTSAPYTVFGLDVGSWTIRAESRGFVSTTTVLYVPDDGDIGDPQTGAGNLDLPLGQGLVIRGTVSVTGDTALLAGAAAGSGPAFADPGAFAVFVEALDPATRRSCGEYVRLSTAATVTAATFTITGLEPGSYRVDALLRGYRKTPPGPATVEVSTSAPGVVGLEFSPDSARAEFAVWIPPPAPPVPLRRRFRRGGILPARAGYRAEGRGRRHDAGGADDVPVSRLQHELPVSSARDRLLQLPAHARPLGQRRRRVSGSGRRRHGLGRHRPLGLHLHGIRQGLGVGRRALEPGGLQRERQLGPGAAGAVAFR